MNNTGTVIFRLYPQPSLSVGPSVRFVEPTLCGDLRGSFTSSNSITIHEMGRLGARD